jgi:hypothetical protein
MAPETLVENTISTHLRHLQAADGTNSTWNLGPGGFGRGNRQPPRRTPDTRSPIWPRTRRPGANAIPGSYGVRPPTVLLPAVEPGLRSPAHLEGTTERQPAMRWTPIAPMVGHPARFVPFDGNREVGPMGVRFPGHPDEAAPHFRRARANPATAASPPTHHPRRVRWSSWRGAENGSRPPSVAFRGGITLPSHAMPHEPISRPQPAVTPDIGAVGPAAVKTGPTGRSGPGWGGSPQDDVPDLRTRVSHPR